MTSPVYYACVIHSSWFPQIQSQSQPSELGRAQEKQLGTKACRYDLNSSDSPDESCPARTMAVTPIHNGARLDRPFEASASQRWL